MSVLVASQATGLGHLWVIGHLQVLNFMCYWPWWQVERHQSRFDRILTQSPVARGSRDRSGGIPRGPGPKMLRPTVLLNGNNSNHTTRNETQLYPTRFGALIRGTTLAGNSLETNVCTDYTDRAELVTQLTTCNCAV